MSIGGWTRRAQVLGGASAAILAGAVVWGAVQLPGFMMWWDLGRPPHPNVSSPSEAGAALAAVSPERQFEAAFFYGERCGASLPIEQLVLRADALTGGLQGHYWDGVGHGYAGPVSPAADVASRIDTWVPVEFAPAMHQGVVRRAVIDLDADPVQTRAFVAEYVRASGLPGGLDGVRAGLQDVARGDVADALARLDEWPEDWQGGVVESLGWLASEDADTIPSLVEAAPSQWKCHFVHGAARGLALDAPWNDARGWSRVAERLSSLPDACSDARWRGVGWAVFTLLGHDPGEAELALTSIRDAQGQQIARALVATATAGVGHGGRPLEMWDLERELRSGE